jgi:AraC-like DNA-binding protein
MTLHQREGSGPLRGQVRSYGFEEVTATLTRRREGPGPEVVVILSFGNEWRVGGALEERGRLERLDSFVGGPRDTSVVTEHDGWSAGMQINLAPTTARRIFGLPMRELTDRNLPLDDLFGRDAQLLVERVAGACTWDERFAIVDGELARRLASAPARDTNVLWAWHRLRRSRGRVAVQELARELDWSRRRLVERFRDEVGLAPKTVARLFRFEHALELARAGAGWADVAHGAGYYDQSHLANDFRAITGTTPRGYVTNLQAAAAAAA